MSKNVQNVIFYRGDNFDSVRFLVFKTTREKKIRTWKLWLKERFNSSMVRKINSTNPEEDSAIPLSRCAQGFCSIRICQVSNNIQTILSSHHTQYNSWAHLFESRSRSQQLNHQIWFQAWIELNVVLADPYYTILGCTPDLVLPLTTWLLGRDCREDRGRTGLPPAPITSISPSHHLSRPTPDIIIRRPS